MPPAVLPRTASGQHVRHISRTLSSSFSSLAKRAADISEPSLVSVFALVISKGGSVSKRAASVVSDVLQSSSEAHIATAPLSLHKRQQAVIFAIPRSYKGLDSGPAPGAVVGIVLGSIVGFILCLYILLLSLQFAGYKSIKVEEEIIVTKQTRSRSRSRRTSRHSSHHTVPPAPVTPPAPSRRSSRRHTEIIVEEHIRRTRTPSLEEVIVEEHESSMGSIVEQEIVEVIEENTTISSRSSVTPPPKPSSRRESRRSGFRTVDPAEFGGGRSSMRRLSRRDDD